MTSAVEHPYPTAAHHHNVDNLLAAYAGNDRIVPPPHAAAARTVRLQRRRRTFPESSPWHQLPSSCWTPAGVDNSALRELSSLALFR